jgi:hypothetical protein
VNIERLINTQIISDLKQPKKGGAMRSNPAKRKQEFRQVGAVSMAQII